MIALTWIATLTTIASKKFSILSEVTHKECLLHCASKQVMKSQSSQVFNVQAMKNESDEFFRLIVDCCKDEVQTVQGSENDTCFQRQTAQFSFIPLMRKKQINFPPVSYIGGQRNRIHKPCRTKSTSTVGMLWWASIDCIYESSHSKLWSDCPLFDRLQFNATFESLPP